MKIAYLTPSLYIPGGVERVLTTKANWLAENTDHDIYIILTDGYGKEPFYPLHPKVHVINLCIDFEELWHLPFYKKVFVYLKKQRIYKHKLEQTLQSIKPDITDSLLRREINFISKLKDGSVKIGELHVNRKNYRNFESNETNLIKDIFSKCWMYSLVKKLQKLDTFIVLSNEDKNNWPEIKNINVVPNPLEKLCDETAKLENKNVIAVGRYTYQKGFDLLLEAWKHVQDKHPDWKLDIYGRGEKTPYQQLAERLGVTSTVHLNDATSDITSKYLESSMFVLSSRFEGFGMVLIEAMNCGLPCVSFTCPCGPRDIVTDEEDGLLVENGNVEALAAKICYLIENPDKRRAMGVKAKAASYQYKVENIMPRWTSLFSKLVKSEV